MGTDRRRAPAGRIALLGFITLAVLLMALLFPPFSRLTAHAQANSPPQFLSEAITFTIDENTPWNSNIGNPVAAADDNNDALTYSLENAGVSHFGIDSSTGQLRTGSSLDYEARDSYTVKVIATDPSNGSDSVTVTITVNNVDEPGTVSLSWRQPQVGTELEAALTDPDGIVSGPTWQWSQADSKNGNYTNISGATSASYPPVTGDAGKFLRATASYTDATASGKTAQMVSYRQVREVPSDNNAPAFPGPEYFSGGYGCPGSDPDRGVCLSVKRSAPVGARIYQPARAEDPDDDEVRYSLEGTDVTYFDIVASTGELLTKQLFRDVDETAYTVTIKASDPSGGFDTVTATIGPSGGKGSPVVEGPEEIRYPENGTWRVAAYTAENKRGPITGWIINVEPGGGDGDHFDINDEGVLTFEGPPDYEKSTDEGGNQEYSFSIMAYDTNPPNRERPGRTYFRVKVIVTGVTEPGPPEITGPASVEYSEDRTDAVATYTVANPVAWTLSGDDAGDFSISDGVLTFNTPPDYEAKSSYSVMVTATDPSNASDSTTVTITVTNVEEAGTVDLSSVQPQVDTPLTATLSDPDGGVTGTTWKWESSSDQTTWAAITGATGGSYTPVAGDVGNYLRVTASYTDGEGSGKSAQAVSGNTVQAAPITNSGPVFSGDPATREIAENTVAGENIGGPVAATDGDGDSLTYSLGGDNAASFDIAESSGQLLTKDALDYETGSSYSVIVSVSDNKDAGGNADTATDDTITVTITVTNVEETPEFLATETGARSVAENTAAGENIGGPVVATDDDDGDSLTYSLGGDDAASFEIVESSGQLLTKDALDYETGPSYSVIVSVSDNKDVDGNANTATDDTVTVTITVTNVEEAPEFLATETGARSVAENTEAGQNIGGPVAAADDDGDSLTYSLGGTDSASFDIVESSGQLRTKATLDYEDKPSYSVTVSVSDSKDSGGNTDTATDDTITVTITVTNVEEAGTLNLSSVEPQVGTPLTTTLSDPDDDVTGTTWKWESSSDQTNWAAITGATEGSYSPVGGDVGNYLRVTASYTDGEGSGKSAQAVSDNAVQAAPLTNSAPVFSGDPVTREIAENTAAGRNIGDPVTAADDDDDALTYSLGVDDAASFGIEASSGQLLTKASLDYEAKSSYLVTVTATDPSNASDSITVNITVTDVEEAPEFPTGESRARSVAENTAAGRNIGSPVAATDGDGDLLTYSLGGTDAASFDISGVVGPTPDQSHALNYEAKSSYSVTVSDRDSRPFRQCRFGDGCHRSR